VLPWLSGSSTYDPCHLAFYEDAEGVIAAQYIPSEFLWKRGEDTIKIKQMMDRQTNWGIRDPAADQTRRPNSIAVDISIECELDVEFTVKLRLPDWLSGHPAITVNGQETVNEINQSGFIHIHRVWQNGDRLRIVLPKTLTAFPLPDQPNMVAFLDGPVLLAGLCDEERTLIGDINNPGSILTPDNEREWNNWLSGYRTVNQDRGFRFVPLHEIEDQVYTVYFPVR